MTPRTVEMALATPGLDAAGRPTRVPLGVSDGDGQYREDLGAERMLVNIGPQHPATHGVLRLVLELEGETVRRCIPHLGYLHSGFEKLGEYRHYNQIIPLTDRTDYLSPMANNVCLALAVEKLMGLELPERCKVLRVIARDASVWFNTIMINQGTSAGIALNMPVITPGGIVGRVVAVSPVTAQVMLITDEKAAAGAIVGQLGGSGSLGSVRGLGNSGLVEMRYVSGLQKVEVGDYILTTGQDGIYPAGLNVGEVIEVKNGTATQPHQIYIRPSARLDQLTEVAVLLYQPPQRPAPEQTLPNVDKTKPPSNR